MLMYSLLSSLSLFFGIAVVCIARYYYCCGHNHISYCAHTIIT